MKTKEETKELPKTLRVLFFDTPGGGIDDRIIRKSVQDYSKVFLYSGFITHCALVLGDTYYEVSMSGTFKEKFDEAMMLWDNTVAYYEISLEGMDEGSLEATRFMLDYDVNVNRKLNLYGCVTYLENYVRMQIERWTNKHGVLPYVDYNIKPGTFAVVRADRCFNLPFTCATQVANVMNRLFEIEPSYDCLLPEAMFFNLEQLALAGFGEFFSKDFLEV